MDFSFRHNELGPPEKGEAMFRRVTALAVLCALVFLPLPAAARQKAQIVNGHSERIGNDWTVSFHVEGSFTEKMENAILSGISTTFTFYFALYRVVPRWADEKLFSWKVRRTIRFDNLKRQFGVVMDNEATKVVYTDFNEAKKAMVSFEKIPVVVAGSLAAHQQFYVRVKAELDPVDMPIVLNELFFFVSLWDFVTPWTRIDLSRPAPER